MPGTVRREITGQQLQQRPIEREGDARAVARLAIGAERAAMAQRSETRQRQRQHPIARPPAGVRHETDAASIVLVAFVVERAVGAGGDGGAGSSPWLGLRREGRTDRRREEPMAVGRVGGATSGRGWEGPRQDGRVTLDRRPHRGRTGRDPSPRTRTGRGSRGSRRRP